VGTLFFPNGCVGFWLSGTISRLAPDSRMATLGFKNKYPVRIFQRAIEEEVNKF
jgi:hypothetical protein